MMKGMLKRGIFWIISEMAWQGRQCFPREGEGCIYSASSELERSSPLCSPSLLKNISQSETSLLLAKVEWPIDCPVSRHSAVMSSLIIHTGSGAPPHNICEHVSISTIATQRRKAVYLSP